MKKRRIFISFDHDDTSQVVGFLGLRQFVDNFEFYNHKLDRRINSTDVEYVKRVIREEYIRPASVTVVLIGNKTAESSWVRWEIEESLRQGKGLLGIRLKGTWGPIPEGILSNAVGGWDPDKFADWVEWAYEQAHNQRRKLFRHRLFQSIPLVKHCRRSRRARLGRAGTEACLCDTL